MITVVVPTYNRSQSLKRCLLSLRKQAFGDFELIVVDDGSTDNTKEIFDSICDSRFKYVKQDNSGQSAARNKGIRLAKGDIVAFTDDDCEVDQNWLCAISNSMINGVGCVKGRTEILNLNDFTKELRKYIYRRGSAATNNIAYDKNAVISAGLFDETMRLHEDLDLLWRFRLAGGKYKYSNEMVVFHEFEDNMVEFKKVAYNRGKGLRHFFLKYLRIKPVIAFMYLGGAFLQLLIVPVGKGNYLRSVRAFYMLRGFLFGREIFKIH